MRIHADEEERKTRKPRRWALIVAIVAAVCGLLRLIVPAGPVPVLPAALFFFALSAFFLGLYARKPRVDENERRYAANEWNDADKEKFKRLMEDQRR